MQNTSIHLKCWLRNSSTAVRQVPFAVGEYMSSSPFQGCNQLAKDGHKASPLELDNNPSIAWGFVLSQHKYMPRLASAQWLYAGWRPACRDIVR